MVAMYRWRSSFEKSWSYTFQSDLKLLWIRRINWHTHELVYDRWRAYSVNEELGSKRLGLFRFLETETTARGECLRGSTTRGEAGLTVLGDCLRVICFDIFFFLSSSRWCKYSVFRISVLHFFSNRGVYSTRRLRLSTADNFKKRDACESAGSAGHLITGADSLQSIWNVLMSQPVEGYNCNVRHVWSLYRELLMNRRRLLTITDSIIFPCFFIFLT